MAYAYIFFLLFFALLGALHALEEVEVQGRRYRAAPVFPALLLLVPAVMMLAFMVPGLGGLVATAVEPTAATIRVQLQPNVTAVTYTSKPPASEVLEPQLSWEYWVYALCAAAFPLAGYYAGYNAAAWLESREMVPLLVRIPAVMFVVEEEVERPKPVEVYAKKEKKRGGRKADAYLVLGGERWG
jgi:hypothetical protein